MLRPFIPLLLALWSWSAFGAELRVHFLDVGQGDSALIISPTGKKVLIDGGGAETARRLALRLRAIDRRPIDVMVMTHPHADHMGGLSTVVRFVGIKQFLEPGFQHPSAAYEELLERVKKKVGGPVEPRVSPEADPYTVDLGGGAFLEILWPRRPTEDFLRGTRSDPNSNSIVARLVYGRTSVLFTGDAEPELEDKLLRIARPRLTATVLKVGHHGSRHSSTREFLRAVGAKAAVISCGAGNDYGHPAAETLERLGDAGAQVFRTDLGGEVLLASDGETVTLQSERGASATIAGDGNVAQRQPARVEPPAEVVATAAAADEAFGAVEVASTEAPVAEGFAASRRSDVFHKASCDSVKTIREANLVHYDDRRQAARGRQPAKDCNP